MTRRRTTRRIAVAVGLLALLGGCAQIPTHSEVEEGAGSVQVPFDAVQVPAAPTPGDTPEGIVQGFLKAVVTRQYGGGAVVLEYLTPAAQTSWDSSGVVVYSQMRLVDDGAAAAPTPGGDPDAASPSADDAGAVSPTPNEGGESASPAATASASPQPGDTDTVTVQATQVATVDTYGRYKETGEVDYTTTFTLAYTAGQWRIDKLDPMILISQPEFERQYDSISLYYPSADNKRLVPDLRWFPTSRTEATDVAKAQLAGPSSWLEPALHNPIPAGTELSPLGVTVDTGGTATVSLTAQAKSASALDRELMSDCITATLEQVTGVSSVAFAVGSDTLEIANQLGPLTRDEQAPDTVVYLANDTVMVLDGTQATSASPAVPQPLPGYGSLAGLDASSPAMSLQTSRPTVVVVSHGTTLMTPPQADGTAGTVLYQGGTLTAPSFDRFDWVWISDAQEPDQVVAVPTSGGAPVVLKDDWLAGRQITGVRVSRDGARMAIVSQAAGAATVDVVAISRDKAGKPTALGDALPIGVTVSGASSPAWADDLRVVVLTKADKKPVPTPYVLEVGGTSQSLSSVDDGDTIAAGRGLRSLYVGTTTGQVMTSQASAWDVVAAGRWPAFPG